MEPLKDAVEERGRCVSPPWNCQGIPTTSCPSTLSSCELSTYHLGSFTLGLEDLGGGGVCSTINTSLRGCFSGVVWGSTLDSQSTSKSRLKKINFLKHF